GSLKIEVDFDAAGGKNDVTFSHVLPAPVNASSALMLIADVKVDVDSPDTPWGDEGYFQIVSRNGDDWGWNPQFAGNLDSDGNWKPFDMPPVAPVDDVRALTMQLWGGGAQALQGKTTLWIDNLRYLGDFPDPSLPGDTDDDGDVDLTDL